MAHVVLRGQVTGPRRLGLLPAETTSFVGRTTELAWITALLGTARMVTVVGPAGVGKTRVGLRAAAAMADQFPDGVRLVDLGAISDPDRLADTVAGALGLSGALGLRGARGLAGQDAAGEDAAGARRAVLGHLRGRKLLLILDTCEHLVDACAAFADAVLRAAPGVTLLATSRQPLDAQGEHAFPLLPLSAESDAVDLFAHRVAAVLPSFAVTPRNRADVVRLCRRLDGIPLAIEFAAVRLRALPLSELASQLESGIRTLTVSRRGTSPRHRTLRASVQWSYQLCTPAERVLWERLSVFAGTFDVRGAEYVCADGSLPREQVVHALIGLVDKSVVLRDSVDPSRYRLLGGLREFGADALAENGGQERFLDRLIVWRAASEGGGPPGLRGGDTGNTGGWGDPAGAPGGWAGPPGSPAGAPGSWAGAPGGPAAVLTRREREIAELVAKSLSNREIAVRLFISKRTVDAHVEHIFSKLEISSRVQLTVLLQDQVPWARASSER
jgi:predicted ATPase/DNA-binding CsgD family transcriptional regulator